MKVAVVDYGVGNLKSVAGALKLAAGARSADVIVTSCASVLKACDRVVLPGVGSFGSCWRKLQACALADALCHVALVTKLPVLGVCVGMQLMASLSLEGAKTAGFNWLPGVVTRLPSRAGRVPHVGWNHLQVLRPHCLFSKLPTTTAYFVHSYQYTPLAASSIVAVTTHGVKLTAAIASANLAGVQFHPEKSHALGVAMFRNFLSWRP